MAKHSYIDPKLKVLLHFNSTDNTTSLFNDEVKGDNNERNNWQPVGRTFETNSLVGSAIASYLTGAINLSQGAYLQLGYKAGYEIKPYPFLLGGQDFTIEGITVLTGSSNFSINAPIFSMCTEEYIKYDSNHPNKHTVDNYGLAIRYSGGSNRLGFKLPYANSTSSNDPSAGINLVFNPVIISSKQIAHFAIVYKHNEQQMLVYINGVLKRTEGLRIKLPRLTYKVMYFGKEYDCLVENEYTSPYNVLLDEFRICDGIALDIPNLYTSNIPSQAEVNAWDTDYSKGMKLFTHLDIDAAGGLGVEKVKNEVPTPISELSRFTNNSQDFGWALKLDGNRQYLELGKSYFKENESDTAKTVRDSGLRLGGRKFSMESIIKVDNDFTKKGTVFELNKNGCNDPSTYFKLTVNKSGSNFILRLEQNKVLTYKDNSQYNKNIIAEVTLLLDNSNVINKYYHWMLHYDHDKNRLLLYIDGNLSKTVENIIFPNTDFKFFLIGGNIQCSNNSYPYNETFKGLIDEFRILDDRLPRAKVPPKEYDPTEWEELYTVNHSDKITRKVVTNVKDRKGNNGVKFNTERIKSKKIKSPDNNVPNTKREVTGEETFKSKTERKVVINVKDKNGNDGVKFDTERHAGQKEIENKDPIERNVIMNLKDKDGNDGEKFDTEREIPETEKDHIVAVSFEY